MRMLRWSGLAACMLALQIGVIAQSMDKPSLYKRLGGYDAIAAVTDDFIGRLAGDADLGVFFKGHSTEAKMHIRQMVVDQLCAATGGPCVYVGKSMKQAHAGLGITDAQWTKSVMLLTESLDKFKVPKAEQTDLLTIASSLKGDIVEK
jgi:hemoglobin